MYFSILALTEDLKANVDDLPKLRGSRSFRELLSGLISCSMYGQGVYVLTRAMFQLAIIILFLGNAEKFFSFGPR